MTAPQQEPTADDSAPIEKDEAPVVPAGDDVRVGPDQSDEPEAGAAEPTD